MICEHSEFAFLGRAPLQDTPSESVSRPAGHARPTGPPPWGGVPPLLEGSAPRKLLRRGDVAARGSSSCSCDAQTHESLKNASADAACSRRQDVYPQRLRVHRFPGAQTSMALPMR